MKRTIATAAAVLLLAATQPAHAFGVVAGSAVAASPAHVAVDPIRDRVYVASYGAPGPGGDLVTVFDGTDMTPLAGYLAGVDPYGIDVDPVLRKVFVGSSTSGTVTIIDERPPLPPPPVPLPVPPIPTVITLTGIPGAAGVAVDPVTHIVFVGSTKGRLTVIDGVTNTITGGIDVATGGTFLVEVDPVLHRVFMPEYGAGKLHIFDGISLTKLATVSLPPFAYGSPVGGVAVHPITHDIYVTNEKGGIYRLDARTFAIEASAPVGLPGELPFGTWGVEVNPFNEHVYVTQFHTNSVFVLDTESLATLGSAATGPIPVPAMPTSGPAFSAFDLLTRRLYVTNLLAGSVSVLTDP